MKKQLPKNHPYILLVDDDQDILEAVKLLLNYEGYEVKTTKNSIFFETLKDQPLPSIILLDVLLSGEDGRDICKRLKNDAQTKHIPIIMISAHPSAAKNAMDCGAEAFIAKPFDIEKLLVKVKKYMN